MADLRSAGATTARGEAARAERRRWLPPRARLPLVVTAAAVVVLAGIFLAMSPGGTDLSAQVARTDFVRAHGIRPIDFRWYGGVDQFGYSLVSPFVMALIGVRLTGALAAVASSLLFTMLLVRTGARRPALGGVAGAICIVANLVSGRITYSLGLAFALGALVALTDHDVRRRRVVLVLAGGLAAATSPVAGLFAGLAGVALILTGRRNDGLLLGAVSLIPIALIAGLFGHSGWMNISSSDVRHAVVLCAVVLVVVPHRVVRVGALLAGAGIVVAYLVHTPVGLNSIRLPVMFAIPVVVATMRWRAPVAILLAALLGWWQSPVMLSDLHDAGTATASASYYTPLTEELAALHPTGRVEVPPTRDYWESVYVARHAQLARGWWRQLDIGYNGIFFGGRLSVSTYHDWLANNAVEYVAVSDGAMSWTGRAEATLIRQGLPYLHQVWARGHWTLYAVTSPTPLASRPATMVTSGASSITVQVSRPGIVALKVRFTRWLTVSPKGACVSADGAWTRLVVNQAGTYKVSSALRFSQPEHCAD